MPQAEQEGCCSTKVMGMPLHRSESQRVSGTGRGLAFSGPNPRGELRKRLAIQWHSGMAPQQASDRSQNLHGMPAPPQAPRL